MKERLSQQDETHIDTRLRLVTGRTIALLHTDKGLLLTAFATVS